MRVTWTPEEQQALIAEAERLVRIGRASTLKETIARAQLVLPKDRRRPIGGTSKVPWLCTAIHAAKQAQEAQQAQEDQQAEEASSAKPGRRKVHWTSQEKELLCAVSAQLLTDLQANGPHDALEKAVATLPVDRQRQIPSMTLVADWYFEGLQTARDRIQKTRDETALRASRAAEVAAQEAAEAHTPAPEPAVPAVQAAQPPMGLAIASIFNMTWPTIREYLVQEIADLVAEGVRRGLANVQLTPPASVEDAATPHPHVPFAASLAPKPKLLSVLVAGLKGAQVPQIKADFGSRLDLRFVAVDESKDQLRAMTERADMTIAVVDFLSHSHTDIIKARSPKCVELHGGMTRLREQLAQLVAAPLNGHAHA